MGMFARARRPDRALQWKDDMQRAGHSLSQNLYGRLVHCCALKGRLDDGLALLQEMEDNNIPAPKERQLQALRELCRYRGVAPALLPEDPLAWAREMAKKARKK